MQHRSIEEQRLAFKNRNYTWKTCKREFHKKREVVYWSLCSSLLAVLEQRVCEHRVNADVVDSYSCVALRVGSVSDAVPR